MNRAWVRSYKSTNNPKTRQRHLSAIGNQQAEGDGIQRVTRSGAHKTLSTEPAGEGVVHKHQLVVSLLC